MSDVQHVPSAASYIDFTFQVLHLHIRCGSSRRPTEDEAAPTRRLLAVLQNLPLDKLVRLLLTPLNQDWP